MRRSDVPDGLPKMAIGIFVLLAPVLFLVVTLSFLVFTGNLLASELTIVDIIELYIIDLLLFVVIGYGLYRVILMAAHELPEEGEPRDQSEEKESPREDSVDDRR